MRSALPVVSDICFGLLAVIASLVVPRRMTTQGANDFYCMLCLLMCSFGYQSSTLINLSSMWHSSFSIHAFRYGYRMTVSDFLFTVITYTAFWFMVYHRTAHNTWYVHAYGA